MFIKKDLLMFWRDRRETALAILLPILLVVVLNFAFSNVFGTDAKPISLTLAIINEDDEAAGLKQFEESVLTWDWPEEETAAIVSQARQMAPISLINGYFESPELSEWLTVKHLSEGEALQQIDDEHIDAAIRIPAGYTVQMLNAVILGEDATVPMPFVVKKNTLNVGILGDVIQEFFNHINFQLALQYAAGDRLVQQVVSQPEGSRETIEDSEPFTMGQYFAIAMAVLFPLFLATSVAEKTATEKREQVVNRILITNARPRMYLMGKVCSTFCLVFLQFMFIVIISQVMIGVFSGKSVTFWLGLFVVAIFYALFIAGLSALYTSTMLKVDSVDTANVIFVLVTMVLGTIGGSFVPMYVFPEWLQRIGEWTPNGLTLAVMTKWIQFEQLAQLGIVFLVLIITAMACLLAGIMLFPKRSEQ